MSTNLNKISINQITGEKYDIPDLLDDSFAIDAFLEKNTGKKVVVVQGLGFVGAVMSLVCANALTEEYAVIGIDLPSPASYWKIRSINEGEFPVVASDPKIEDFYRKAMQKGNILATYDPYCYSKADIVIVDINLDVKKASNFTRELKGYEVSLEGFKGAMESVGNYCKQDVLILVETTVPPGTCQKVVDPTIKDCLEKRGLPADHFKLGHSYERVMPGPTYIDSIQNFYRVYSGINEDSADATEKFLRTIISTEKYPLTRLGNTNATEMAKVLENSYRAMNIAFAQEWSRFAEEAGVNIYEVVSAIRMRPTHANLMLPGIGVGGYCLTKDPLLASWSKVNLFQSEEALLQSEKGVMINDQMPLFAFNFLKMHFKEDFREKNILLLGVSYRSDVGDTRYTPVEPLYDFLHAAGANLYTHDPYVSFWEEKGIEVDQDLNAVLNVNYDIIVFSTGHVEYKSNPELIDKIILQKNVFIFDTIGILTNDEITRIKNQHKIIVLGRGDI
jgi:UDP-N-acetyl-D-glucosamine dehydrogenase